MAKLVNEGVATAMKPKPLGIGARINMLMMDTYVRNAIDDEEGVSSIIPRTCCPRETATVVKALMKTIGLCTILLLVNIYVLVAMSAN
jgi:hypothetical protein